MYYLASLVLEDGDMSCCYVQTQVSIHPDHWMSEGEAANAIVRAGSKVEGLPPEVQPRGEDSPPSETLGDGDPWADNYDPHLYLCLCLRDL